MNIKKIKYIDLCCGIGGFRMAIENFEKKNKEYKFECVLSADIKEDAIKTYNLNFGENNKKKNLFDIDNIEEFDLLCSGFPCQPFSSAGNKKGFDDKRGNVIFKIVELCQKYKPKYVILENVSNLITIENGKNLKRICDEFINIGYNVDYKKLNSINFDVPQNRERLFIVCTKDKVVDLNKIEYSKNNILLKNIIDIESKYNDIEENFSKKIIELHKKNPLYGYKIQDKRGGNLNIHSWDIEMNGKISDDEKDLMNKIMKERRKKHWAKEKNIEWMDGMPLSIDDIRTFYNNINLEKMLQNLVLKKYLKMEKPKKIINGKRIYDENGIIGYNICKGKLSFPLTNILNPESFSPTLTATDSNKLGLIIDNQYLRKLNDNELKLLCGFPISFIIPNDVNKYDLFGNMVIPKVVEAILNIIF
jgi:DNA (cytosine-5)-methyltransferase 1